MTASDKEAEAMLNQIESQSQEVQALFSYMHEHTSASSRLEEVFVPATHCNTLQHTVTHCNTLQHTATRCDMLQHTEPR